MSAQEQPQVDVKVQASVFSGDAYFQPMNGRTIAWLGKNGPESGEWRFGTLKVPYGYSSFLIEALVDDGFTIGRA